MFAVHVLLVVPFQILGTIHVLGFFSWSRFFTGGHRNKQLPRNLRNTAYLPNEFFKQILNSKFFAPKQIKFVSILLRIAGLVEWSASRAPSQQVVVSKSGKCTEAILPHFLTKHDLNILKKITVVVESNLRLKGQW
jgi:hypothetical protein